MVRSIAALLVAAVALFAGAPVLAQGVAQAVTSVDIGAHKHLNDATGIINKNNVLHSNNMAMTKGNLRLSQNDDVTLDLEAQGDKEAAIAVDIGAHKHLNAATGIINKNNVIHSNNKFMTKSNLLLRQDDDLTLDLPEELTLTEEAQPLHEDPQEQTVMDFRRRFTFNRGGRVISGWRYPITYWNRFGRTRFGRDCVFNRRFGDFFYC